MKLTIEGCRLLEAVGEHFDRIGHAMSRHHKRPHDTFTLSTSPGIMSGWLVPRLPRLGAARPELELSLQSGSILVNFEREPVDAALGYGHGKWQGRHNQRLFGEWIAPVASPQLVAKVAGPIRTISRSGRCLAIPTVESVEGLVRESGWCAAAALCGELRQFRCAATCGAGRSRCGDGRVVMSKSPIDAGRLVVPGKRHLPVDDAYWLVYPARSNDHPGLQVFQPWPLAEAEDYCGHLPVPGDHDACAAN